MTYYDTTDSCVAQGLSAQATSSAARVGWQPKADETASQARQVATALGTGALSVGALLALLLEWPFWLPLVFAGAMAGMGYCVASLLLIAHDRAMIERMVPAPRTEAPRRGRPGSLFVWVNQRRSLEPAQAPMPTVDEMADRRRAIRLKTFYRESLRLGDATWDYWQQARFSDGDGWSYEEWRGACEMAIRANVAVRPYERASIRYIRGWPEIRSTFRDVFQLAPPGDQDEEDE